jgi:hypothetical protein
MVHVRLGSVAGVDELEALLLRLRLAGSRGAKHFAGMFGCGAGGSNPLPFGGVRSLGSFRVRCNFRVGVARVRDPDKSSEFALLKGFELRYPANT